MIVCRASTVTYLSVAATPHARYPGAVGSREVTQQDRTDTSALETNPFPTADCRHTECDMDFQQVIYDVSDGIATITLNRPEKLNAFTPIMINDWAQAIELARGDDAVRAVIVTGSGRGFCAGGDVGAEGREGSADVLRTSAGPA